MSKIKRREFLLTVPTLTLAAHASFAAAKTTVSIEGERFFINLVKATTHKGPRLRVDTSSGGNAIPMTNVVAASDFLLLHGNGVKDPNRIAEMVAITRRDSAYRLMPILFNEDDHFDFDQPVNNMLKAIGAYASWGYFDPGKSDYSDGYQCPPVNWGINTERKKAFFNLLKQVTGAA